MIISKQPKTRFVRGVTKNGDRLTRTCLFSSSFFQSHKVGKVCSRKVRALLLLNLKFVLRNLI